MMRDPGLPYAHLNLRTNPFRELTPPERVDLAVVEVEPWVRLVRAHLSGMALPSPGEASGPSRGTLVLQLLGPPGCGKTTHLDALHRHFAGAPRGAWSADGGGSGGEGWPPLPTGRLLFMDDAHALPERRWPRVLSGRGAIVAATQIDLGPALARAGGASLVTVAVAEAVTLHRVRRMVSRRVECARRGPGPLPKIEGPMLVSLLSRHGPDLRALTDDLYDHIQTHPPVAP